MNNMQYARHGDLIIKPIAKLPKGEYKEVESFVLAEGEHTGHRHVIVADRPETKMRIFTDINGNHVMEIQNGTASITHEEHKKITLVPGFYIQEVEQEYDYFTQEINKVID